MDLRVLILSITAYCGLILVAKVSGECYVKLPDNPSLRPTFRKRLGSRTATIPNDQQYITIHDDEQMSAYCVTRFIEPDVDQGQGKLDLTCTGNRINNYRRNNPIYFECDSLKWNLYESFPFRWCSPPWVSYILAQPSVDDYEYLAGICYNIDEMTMVSLHYAVSPKFSNYSHPQRLRNYIPSVQVQNIPYSFVDHNINSSLYDNPQFKEWMEFSNYQNHSIIQNPNLYNDSYDKFGGLLDFYWWPGLRLGNWRRYEEALSQHIEADAREYDILGGISGTVSAPIHKESCQRNLTLVELVDRTNQKIPLYVWQYLKSPKNDKDNVVVIGVNSPFYEFYNEKDLVFCTDICPQINWLQKVQSTFRYKTMGIVFCCSVDDVRSSNRLSGFPLPPKPVAPLPPPLPIFRAKPSDDILDEPPERDYQNSYNEDEFSGDDSIREFGYVRSD